MKTSPINQPASKGSPVPDLYGILRIRPEQATVEFIQRAVNQFETRLAGLAKMDGSPTGNAVENQKRLIKVIELLKLHLLDPSAKERYDVYWHQSFGDTSSSNGLNNDPVASTTVGSANVRLKEETPQFATAKIATERMRALLPAGDPDAPFDLSKFQTAHVKTDSSSSDQGFQLLLESMAASAGKTTENLKGPYRENSKQGLVLIPPATSATGRGRTNKKRQPSVAVGLIFLIGGISGLVGLVALLTQGTNKPSLTESKESTALATNGVAPVPDRVKPASTGQPAKGSGLPKPGEGFADVGRDLNSLSQADTQPASAAPATQTLSESAIGTDRSIAAANTESQPRGMAPITESKPAENSNAQPIAIDPRTSKTTAEPLADGTKPATASNSSAKASMAAGPSVTEQESWTRNMLAAKLLIGEQAYEKAAEKLAAIERDARSTVQKEQLARLKTVLNLAKEFQATMILAASGLKAGEVITVGTSAKASFVGGNAATITFKVTGENRRYTFKEISIGLAFALFDLKSDIAHPSSLARKAAFSLVHTKTNDAAIQRARQMMIEASQMRAVAQDMPQVFDDDYELPKSEAPN